MPNLYRNPPAEESRYQAEPGFRPLRSETKRNPWRVAFLLAVLAALTGSALLWHAHQGVQPSTAPQPPVVTPQPAAQS